MPRKLMQVGALCFALSAGLASNCYAASARYDSIGGVSSRIDLGVSALQPDLDGTRDYSAIVTVTGVYQSMLGMTSFNKLGVLWGVGVGGQFGTLDDDGVEAEFLGMSGRYYLGITYALNEAWRLQWAPYAGVGIANVEIDVVSNGNRLVDNDESAAGEYGLEFHVMKSQPESMEFGAGISFNARVTDFDFSGTPIQFSVHNEQYYVSLNFSLGWRW